MAFWSEESRLSQKESTGCRRPTSTSLGPALAILLKPASPQARKYGSQRRYDYDSCRKFRDEHAGEHCAAESSTFFARLDRTAAARNITYTESDRDE